MCYVHWIQCPSFLQNAIRRYNNSGEHENLREAERAAIKAVDAKLYWNRKGEEHATRNQDHP